MLEFDGVHNPDTFLNWLKAIERIFDEKRYDERKRYKFAVHTLTEYASDWYEELKARRKREGKEKIQSWVKLKKHLKRKFLPRDYEQKLYFQRIKSPIVHRKQEERKRLFLDTRDPPKPPMIEKSDPYENILALLEKLKESFRKERQEKEEAAMKAQQQEGELVCESKPTQVTPTPSEVNHDQEKQQTMAETPHLAHVKSPTKQQIEAIQEEHKQPLVLHKETDLVADLSVLSIENKGDDEEDMIQEELTSPMKGECSLSTSMLLTPPFMEEVTAQRDHIQAVPVVTSEDVHAESPTLREIALQEDPSSRPLCPSQPMIDDVKEDDIDITVLPLKKHTDQQARLQPAPSLPREETQLRAGHTQAAPYTRDEINLQSPKQNLRANSFQEGEIDAGARGPKKRPNEEQPMSPFEESLRSEIGLNVKNTHEYNNKLEELKYQNPP